MREREGLIARVAQMRRAAPGDAPHAETQAGSIPADQAAVERLEARVAQLEALVEGFQDSVHRESLRQRKRIDDLEARMEPGVLAVALSQNARQRGI